jgi:sugar-phosphatase
VLFDADGVLVDSHRGYRTVWERWSLLHGLDPVSVWAATHARRPVDTIGDVAPHLDAGAEYARLVEYVAESAGAFPVYPGAAALLGLLPAHRWAVVTSGDAVSVRARMTAGDLPLPAVLVDGHSVSRGKPDPEGYLLAAHRLGVCSSQCLVVEDAPAGVRAGREAGATVLALTTSHDAGQLQQADAVVDSLAQAQPRILAWLAGAPVG